MKTLPLRVDVRGMGSSGLEDLILSPDNSFSSFSTLPWGPSLEFHCWRMRLWLPGVGWPGVGGSSQLYLFCQHELCFLASLGKNEGDSRMRECLEISGKLPSALRWLQGCLSLRPRESPGKGALMTQHSFFQGRA